MGCSLGRGRAAAGLDAGLRRVGVMRVASTYCSPCTTISVKLPIAVLIIPALQVENRGQEKETLGNQWLGSNLN